MIPEEIQAYFKANYMVIFLVAACVLVALFSLIFLPANNPIENAAEKEIETLTGLKLDFTP